MLLAAVKHSKSFADDSSMEELRETARRLTSDCSFRETVYKTMARQDAASKTEKREEAGEVKGCRRPGCVRDGV